MAFRRNIGKAWLAAFLAALLLSLTACTGLTGMATPGVPGEVKAAGDEVAALARGVDGIDGTELTFAPPREATRNGIASTRRGIWEITLMVQLDSGTADDEALVAAHKIAMAVGVHAEDYSWVVRMEDSQVMADAVIYQSRPSTDAQASNFSHIEYIADARKYRTLPGVLAVSIDGSGTVTTSVKGFTELENVVAGLQAHSVRTVVVAAPQGKATFQMSEGRLDQAFLALLSRLGTTHPVNEMSVGESAVGSERILTLSVPNRENAAAVEKALKENKLAHTEGQAIVRDYVISYGEPKEDLDGDLTRPMLYGQLGYTPALLKEDPAAQNPEAAPTFAPPAYEDSPACTADQVSGDVEGRVEAALGHRSMKVVLSNVSEKTCSVNGYPVVKFQDPDGGELPVDLVNSSSYMFADPGPSPISLAPGGTAWAMLHWRANSTSQGFILPAYIEVAPSANGAFAARCRLVETPDIVEGTEIKVSAWAWPDPTANR